MITRTEEEGAQRDLAEAAGAVLLEVRRFYEVGCLENTNSPLATAWRFYVAAAARVGVPLPEYQRLADPDEPETPLGNL